MRETACDAQGRIQDHWKRQKSLLGVQSRKEEGERGDSTRCGLHVVYERM